MSNLLRSRVFRAVKGLNPLGSMLLGVMLLLAAPVQAETTVLPLAQWVNADIGTTPAAGSGVYNATTGTYAVSGSGADIWGTADNFHYSYQTLSGDGVVVVRVQSVVNTHGSAKVGLMIRESLQPGSKNAMMLVTPTSGCGLQYRTATGGTSASVMTAAITAPRWLKLERRGNLISGYQSADGVTWTLVRCVNLSLPTDVLVGFAACSRVTTKVLTTAVMDQVQLIPFPTAGVLPWPWTETAIGQSTDQGVALFDGSFVLANLGADITATADRCKFVNRTLVGDGSLVVKVASNGSADSLSRFGLMMRENFDANAKNVLLSLTTGNSLAFQSRQSIGGTTASRAASVTKAPPVWIKLTRTGNSFTASYSDDGATWTVQGTETIAMGPSIQVGLAYSNRSTSIWAFGAGDQLKLVTPLDSDGNGLPDAWENFYFGRLGVDLSADTDGDELTHAQEWQLGTHPLVTTLPGQQPVVAIVAGDQQTGSTGGVLPQPLVVKVTNAATGAPLPGVLVAFQVTSGQGLFGSGAAWTPSISLVSDSNGLVQTGFQFSSLAGATTVWAAAGTQPSGSVNFNLKAWLGVPGSAFQLDSGSIGVVSLPSQNQFQSGIYTMTAATGDIGSTADSLNYAWQSLPGDGLIVARVASLVATNAGAKAGLMIRESLNANARQVSMVVTPGSGVIFGWRDLTAGATSTTIKTGQTAPKWLALRSSSGRIAGYYSDDGRNWVLLGSRAFAATQPVHAGLAFSTNSATYSTATFASVSVSPLAPTPWVVADIGTFNSSNIDEFSADSMLIRAAGNDIGGKADSFRYLYQPMPADGSQVVRVASMTTTNASAKSGVMIRESTAPGSRYVLLAQTPGQGIYLQTRATTSKSASTLATLTGLIAPNWLKLERLGATVSAFQSVDGQTWSKVGEVNWGFAPSLVGLASASLNSTTSTATVFDNLSSELFSSQQGWSAAYFPTNNLSGQTALLRRDRIIDFTWPVGTVLAAGIPSSGYSVRWQGVVLPLATDTYTFNVLSNGGVRLWVNGQLLIDRWALQSSPSTVSGQIALQAGNKPKVVLDYFNGADAGLIQLLWSRAGQPAQVIPIGSMQPADSDSDGLPDTWEVANGLNSLNSADASLIPNGDNLTNLAKFQLGLTLGQRADRVPGGAIMEEWLSLTGLRVFDLTNSSRFPSSPNSRALLTSLETIPNHADFYGERIRGYLVPPADGFYQFWIAGDNQAELWLSSTDSPFDRVKIASAVSYTDPRSYDSQRGQKSAPITLQARHYYYFEVLQKENAAGDNLSVAWTQPGVTREIIDGRYLATFAPRSDNVSGDGLPDAWKTANGLIITNGYGTNGAYGDLDGDGLNNLREYQVGTNPQNANSDADGITDNLEVLAGFNPLDASSRPTGSVAPWLYSDVGLVTTGTARAVDTKTQGYLLAGDGGGINGASGSKPGSDDAFRFLYQSVTGDFDFATKVNNLGPEHGVGALVLRDGLSTKTASASFQLNASSEFSFQVRPDALSQTLVLKNTAAPQMGWLRLQRKGQVVNSYYSADGQYWTLYYSAFVNLPATCNLGMAVWASNTATVQEFSSVNLLVGGSITDAGQNNNSNALLPSVAGQTIGTYTGASTTTTFGSWRLVGNTAVSQTVKAALAFSFVVPADGVYQLEFEAQSGGNDTLNVAFPVQVSIDGQFIDLVNLLLPPGQVGLARIGTPWLKAGTHQAVFLYDNTQSYRYLQVNALRVQTLEGADVDQNGVADWVDTRLNTLNALKPVPNTSFTSPVCVEGTSRFLSMMTLSASGQPVTPSVGPGYGWYANLHLSPTDLVELEASFENGALHQSLSFMWTPLNLLADNTAALPTGILRIRQGDRLLLTAAPDGSTAGSAMVTLSSPGQSLVQLSIAAPQVSPVAYPFDQPGVYTLTGSYTNTAGITTTGTVQVEVVQAQFNGSPSVGLGTVLSWENPLIPANVFLETDQGLSFNIGTALAGGGKIINISTQNVGTSYAVARLFDGGPVLSQTSVFGLTVASNSATANDLLVSYPDGSRLMGTPIMVNHLTPTTTVQISIFVNGVTFEDGTIVKTLTAADFDQYGRVYVKFIYPAGLNTSFCHRITVFDGTTNLGSF